MSSWLPWRKSAPEYNEPCVANACHKKVFCFIEGSGFDKTPSLSTSLKKTPDGTCSLDVINFADIRDSFAVISGGKVFPLRGEDLRVTICTGEGDLLCYRYPVSEQRTILVGFEGIELSRMGKQWIGDSGKNYGEYLKGFIEDVKE